MLTLDVLLSDFSVKVGVGCLIGHLGLVFLFRAIGQAKQSNNNNKPLPPWSQMPSFTAHQIICLPVMGTLIVEGIRHWCFSSASSTTAVDRILAPGNLHISQFVLGMMLFWDLPCGLLTPALRDAAMLAHHIGMLSVAGIALGALSHGRPLLGYYAPFFFGLIEISSLPLIVVDLFHPRHAPWHHFLTANNNNNNNNNKPPVSSSFLSKLNEVCRIWFAITFLTLRAIYFPYVTVTGVIPDLLAVRRLPMHQRGGTDVPNLPLDLMMVCNALFSLLQMYWGVLVLRQVVKLIANPNPPKEKNDKQS